MPNVMDYLQRVRDRGGRRPIDYSEFGIGPTGDGTMPIRANLSMVPPIDEDLGDLRQLAAPPAASPQIPDDVSSYVDELRSLPETEDAPPATPPETGTMSTVPDEEMQRGVQQGVAESTYSSGGDKAPASQTQEEKSGYLDDLLEGLSGGDSRANVVASLGRKGVVQFPVGGGGGQRRDRRLSPYQKASLDLQRQRLDQRGQITPYQQEQLELAKARSERGEGYAERAAEASERAAGAAERSEAREGRAEMLAKRIPNEDRRTLVQIEQANKTIGRVMDEAKDAKFGPIAGRAQQLFRKIGLADPETIGTSARLADAINDYIYATTGKQLNREELGRLGNQLPQVWDSPEAFQKIGQVFQEQLNLAKEEMLQGLEREQFDVSRWRQAPQAAQAPAAAGVSAPAYKVGDMYKGRRILEIDPNNPTRIKVE